MASPFVDKVTITVRAGDGGNGAVTFHREKYVAAGGPDGGDGGRGGDIIFEVDDNMSTLMDFRYKRKYVAGNGADGQGKRCSGRVGESLHIRVPRGTLLRDADSGAIMHDMSSGEPFVAARGGRGGWGNQHFATPTRQVPRFAKPGLPGESHTILLELKLLADVGLVGFPNVGKSTLLSVVSKAHPKIANYHFTTLFPNLGVVYVSEGSSFVMADIPGIIEGTSDELQIRHFDDLWVVEGPWLQRLMSTINFGDYESRMYFDRVLRQSGLFDRLEAMGIEEGDTVSIYDLDFEFRF